MTGTLISPDLSELSPQLAEPLRLAVLASGNGSNLAAIAAAIENGDLNATIQVVIYNNPAAKVAERAAQRQLPAVLLDHRTFASREALDEAIVKTVKDAGADWVIMAGWMRRVTAVLIQAFPQRILNIHPSLLPRSEERRVGKEGRFRVSPDH